MIELTYCPKWFYGRDIIIDIVSMVVLLLIVIFSVSSYRIGKNKKYQWLSFAFSLLFLSFLFKILMNFTVYNHIIETTRIGYAVFTYERIISADNLYFIGHLLYRILTILGLYALYAVYTKPNGPTFALTSILVAVAIFFSNSYNYVFYSLCFVILAMIATFYIKNNYNKRNPKTKLLAASFVIICLSQLVAIFINMNRDLYVVSELMQLLGYLGLLLTYVMVLRDGKKKIKD